MATMTETRPEIRPAIETPESVRCWRCDKAHLEAVTRPYKFTCPRCKAKNQA